MKKTRDFSRGHPSASLRVLRAASVVVVLMITVGLAIMVADHVWQLVLAMGLLAALWWVLLLRLRWWHQPGPLLLICVTGLGGMLALLVGAANVFLLERLSGFQMLGRLELSGRLQRTVIARAPALNNTWEQYGPDPLFYRRKPGSLHRSSYDGNPAKIYETLVDDLGFLNLTRDQDRQRTPIDVFIAGDSVLQGVGGPGIVEEIKAKVPGSFFNLSTGSYSPRQKVAALALFALPKHPRWVVVDFYSRNDPSEIIEDGLCERLGQDYYCRFDTPLLVRALSDDPTYGPWLYSEGPGDGLLRRIQQLKSDSLMLALGTRLMRDVKSFVRRALVGPPQLHAGQWDEAIKPPGFSTVAIRPPYRLEWARQGLGLTVQAYEQLVRATQGTPTKVLLVYNPSSYEIYREVLPDSMADHEADALSMLQRQTLRDYASSRGVAFCDMTEGFHRQVREGMRGLFGHRDGVHWSEKGQRVAANVLVDCFRSCGVL